MPAGACCRGVAKYRVKRFFKALEKHIGEAKSAG